MSRGFGHAQRLLLWSGWNDRRHVVQSQWVESQGYQASAVRRSLRSLVEHGLVRHLGYVERDLGATNSAPGLASGRAVYVLTDEGIEWAETAFRDPST